MAHDDTSFDSIFCGAIEIASAEERAAFIARACGPDEELRRRVERLVDAHFQAGSFLEPPPASPTVSIDSSRAAVSGTVIGPYKLLQPIGEGGMGTVYMAEQTAPVRRLVALKVIKAGMDSRQVLARFEAERQALALMDHPNIAKVLDAGTTDAGRPYFVMELVKGVPITRFCDEHRLSTRAAARAVHPGLPGDPARPPEGGHPPRPQAVERPGRPLRRQAGPQGHRLRRGQGDRPAADRPDAVHRVRGDGRHAGVHEPRAGSAQPARHRHPQRRLHPGRAPLRAVDRLDPAGSQAAQAGGIPRGACG